MTIRTRAVRAIGIAIISAVVIPAAALAAPPTHSPADPPDLVFAPGEICGDGVVLSNPRSHARDTDYPALPDGTTRFAERGMAESRATNAATGAFVDRRGGSAIVYRFAADGSILAQAKGLFFAWYLPGDDSQLGAGLWLVNGRVTETYASDGSFIRATFSGMAIDVCEAIGA